MPTMDQDITHFLPGQDRIPSEPREEYTDDDLRDLAEDIVRYCPSLSHLLLAMGKPGGEFSTLN
jgi:hypothetical protein